MSRIGKKPIVIPEGVDVNFDGKVLKVKGPKGELSRNIRPEVKVDIKDSQILLSIFDDTKESKSLFGLFRSLISNMVTGAKEGFTKTLEIVGVGHRVEISGKQLVFNLGYSSPVKYEIPQGIEARIEQKNRLILNGIDKELLGFTAAKIRGFKPPDHYKGKGIKYLEEVVRRKAGKAGAKK